MAKRIKKVKTVVIKEKGKEGIVDTILKGVSYGTGVLMRKATNIGSDIGKVSKTKPWKKMVSGAGDLCEGTKGVLKKAKKSIEENVDDINESFKEGMESVTGETSANEETSSSDKKTIMTKKRSKSAPKSGKRSAPAADQSSEDPEDEVKETPEAETKEAPEVEETAKASPDADVKVEEIPAGEEVPSSAKKKVTVKKKAKIVKSKGKAKGALKKAESEVTDEKDKPINVDLEKELDSPAEDTKEA